MTSYVWYNWISPLTAKLFLWARMHTPVSVSWPGNSLKIWCGSSSLFVCVLVALCTLYPAVEIPHYSRLLHSPSLVAIGLSMGYETWPQIVWHHPFLIGWSKFNRLGYCLVPHCIMGLHDQWEFPPFFQTPVTVRLPLGLRKGTVKESIITHCMGWCGEEAELGTVIVLTPTAVRAGVEGPSLPVTFFLDGQIREYHESVVVSGLKFTHLSFLNNTHHGSHSLGKVMEFNFPLRSHWILFWPGKMAFCLEK